MDTCWATLFFMITINSIHYNSSCLIVPHFKHVIHDLLADNKHRKINEVLSRESFILTCEKTSSSSKHCQQARAKNARPSHPWQCFGWLRAEAVLFQCVLACALWAVSVMPSYSLCYRGTINYQRRTS